MHKEAYFNENEPVKIIAFDSFDLINFSIILRKSRLKFQYDEATK